MVKTSAIRVLLLFVMLPLTACNGPHGTSLSRLRSADVADLRSNVALLYTRLFPAPGPTFVPVGPEYWPPTLAKLRPLRMNFFRDGLAITLYTEPGMEYGLHILPTGDNWPQPTSTERTQYEKLQDGIYYFAQKR